VPTKYDDVAPALVSLISMRQSRWPRSDYRQAALKLTDPVGLPSNHMFHLDVLRSQRSVLRGKLLSGRRVGHNDTFPSHRKINLARRTKSKPVIIAPPEQLRSEVFDSLRRTGSRSGLCSKTVDHGCVTISMHRLVSRKSDHQILVSIARSSTVRWMAETIIRAAVL
jgi:hypothetical protein